MSEPTLPEAEGGSHAERPVPRVYAFLTAELVCAGLAGTVINTSVTVAVAAIAQDVGASISHVAVLVVLLNVGMAFAMPLAGLAVRAIGSRAVLISAGLSVLGSSVLLSLAPNLFVLGLARLLQGLGSAALVPTSVHAATQLLDGDRRRRALGWWAASNGLGLAFAPLIGGLLLDAAGWRWVTLPTCLLAVGLVVTARLAIPAGLRPDPGVGGADVLPLSLFAGTLMATFAAASAEAWTVCAAGAAVCLGSVGLLRWRAGRSPSLRAALGWLRDPEVRRTSTGAGLQMVANGMVQVAVPAWLIASGVLRAGPAGAVLMAMTLTMAAMGPVSGRASSVPYRLWLRLGLGGCAIGLATVAAASVWSWELAVPGLALLGLGAGALLSPSLTTFSHTVAGGSVLGLASFNVLRLSAFAVGGLAGAAALDLGRPWVAFTLAAAVCGLAAAPARHGE